MTPEFAIGRIPDSIKTESPEFIKFITKYYEWCYENGLTNVLYQYKDILYQNVYSISHDESYLKNIGLDLSLDLSKIHGELLYKFLNEFLETRGSKQSFILLFRMIFNSNVTINMSKDKLMSCSMGKYIRTNMILISGIYPFDLNIKLTGLKSNIITNIESFQPFYIGQSRYYLVECNNIKDEFIIGEPVKIEHIDGFIHYETHLPLINVDIISGGTQYSIDDKIIPSSNMFNLPLYVKNVSKGEVHSIKIIKGGSGYKINEKIKSEDKFIDGYISKVDSNGSIQECQLKCGSYNLTKIPVLYIKSSEGIDAVIEGYSANIGVITSIGHYNSPLFDTRSLSFSTLSEKGTDAVLKQKVVSHYRCEYYKSNSGFIGYGTGLINSYNRHNQSYDIISEIQSSKYSNIVKKYINPTGYVFNSKCVIKDNINLTNNLGISSNAKIIK